jgi:hypothetical protein
LLLVCLVAITATSKALSIIICKKHLLIIY